MIDISTQYLAMDKDMILASSVSRGTTVLAKYTGHAGNWSEFIDSMLENVRSDDQVRNTISKPISKHV